MRFPVHRADLGGFGADTTEELLMRLAGAGNFHAADAQPFCLGDKTAGGLPFYPDRELPENNCVALLSASLPVQ